MTYAAACNERLRLGCAVFVTPLHNPVHLAKSLSTLDQLSRGRLDVGVGTGGPNRPFAAFGVEPETYVARFSEGLQLMKACWTEPQIHFDGRFWELHEEAMEPKPFQKPHPPVWFGGSQPSALRRAVRHGDAFMGAGSTTTAAFADQVKVVRAELAIIGRRSFHRQAGIHRGGRRCRAGRAADRVGTRTRLRRLRPPTGAGDGRGDTGRLR
jgi:alkanesulfonate monooxygenase SsuD/methylene tetrahydromethanopterin reductase-like flavin-dependent oxidoreductase (luciferase family)